MKIQKFSANKGGTEIFKPIENAFASASHDKNMQKRVFLLTDGQINNKEQVI
jgi:uncharacterized protein with von Willebrand factor type A (vWA) domain